MASNVIANSNGLQPNSNGLQPRSHGCQPNSNGLQASSNGCQPNSDGLQLASDGLQAESDGLQPPSGVGQRSLQSTQPHESKNHFPLGCGGRLVSRMLFGSLHLKAPAFGWGGVTHSMVGIFLRHQERSAAIQSKLLHFVLVRGPGWRPLLLGWRPSLLGWHRYWVVFILVRLCRIAQQSSSSGQLTPIGRRLVSTL